jgi:Zn-dependent protease with chaperone function/Zn-finger nucleic acid-binding protein
LNFRRTSSTGRQPPLDFYQISRQQKLKSLAIFVVIVLFYFISFSLVGLLILACFGFFQSMLLSFSPSSLTKLVITSSALAIIVAIFHFLKARRFGAAYIRRRLDAQPPGPNDLYHKRLINTLEEMALAAGLRQVKPYIIPSSAINSLALVEADNSPAIIVSEGLLADFTRDELQAVLAHELAHLINGDSFTLTLVCSLANIFERLREMSEPERAPPLPSRWGFPQQGERHGGHPLFFLAFTLTSLIIALLSTLISREKELQADAKAVAICRSPRALARAIYKAHVKNSLIGDFNPTYSALFIVPPYSGKEGDGFFARLFRTHPPLIKRLRRLCAMVPMSIDALRQEIQEIADQREKSRREIHSPEESSPPELKPPLLSPGETAEEKIWLARSPQKKWAGPFTLDELLRQPFFSPRLWLKNIQEGVEAAAEEFPQVRAHWSLRQQKKPYKKATHPRCPRCHIPLQDFFYEGLPIQICPNCQGKLIDSAYVNRILVRKEVSFSPYIIAKAKKYKEIFIANPFRSRKLIQNASPIACPICGQRMLPRPFTYYYVIPVDKCLLCHKIWFDTDELEILQYLIEARPQAN